ncbi:MAG: metallophosphoesterase family protein [Candidatus Sumerlaeia bacterium]|nr:metallophosphoesterase family protein [Candidatus Sumerlaeia bacterium]
MQLFFAGSSRFAKIRVYVAGLSVVLAAMLVTVWAAEKSKSSKSKSRKTASAKAPSAKTKSTDETSKQPKELSPAFSAAKDTAPERIFLTLTAQPATAQAVSWRMRPTSRTVQAAILPAPAGPIKADAATTVAAEIERLVYGNGETLFHASVEFRNLKPATLYAYRVGDGKVWSEWNHFRTASNNTAPFRFIYLGDVQNGILSEASRVLRDAVLKAPDARFIVHAGDLVTDPFDDQLWYEWYAAPGWVYRSVPSLPVPGNHDVGNKGADKVWRPQFCLPLNGPAGMEELAYWVDYQGVRFVAFDGNSYSSETQIAWLEKVLANNPCAWTIVVMHQPVYSTGNDRDSTRRRELLMPLFDKYGVDLVLQGHDHTYGRTPKIRANRIVEPAEAGTIYAVSVVGTKMYKINPESRPFMARLAGNVQLFQVVSVSDQALTYEAYSADGKLFDAFELQRTGPKRTRLIDRAPKDEHPRESDFWTEKDAEKDRRRD